MLLKLKLGRLFPSQTLVLPLFPLPGRILRGLGGDLLLLLGLLFHLHLLLLHVSFFVALRGLLLLDGRLRVQVRFTGLAALRCGSCAPADRRRVTARRRIVILLQFVSLFRVRRRLILAGIIEGFMRYVPLGIDYLEANKAGRAYLPC